MKAVVVDDEKLALESMRVKLTHIKRINEVHAFLEPEDVLDYCSRYEVDIAFLDISMAQMDGLTLAVRLREIKPSLIVIFVTGYSEYALNAFRIHADGYLMKPMDEQDIEKELDALEQLRRKAQNEKRIRIQCFGDFEIFVNNIPVPFARSKSKEMLAYLVDRRGTKCTAPQIASTIWEDGVYDRQRQKLLSIVRADMIKSLRKAHAECVINNERDGISVVVNQFDCDYYRVLDGDPTALASYTGEYMLSYSWAEFTAPSIGQKKNP